MKVSVERRHIGLQRPFRVSFGAISGMDVVGVEIESGGVRGLGECCPMQIFDQTPESVLSDIAAMAPRIERGEINRERLQAAMPAGAARNALDCALWDYEAKRSESSVWDLTGLRPVDSVPADISIGIETPEETARIAAACRDAGMIKLKLGGEDDLACARAVRETLPQTALFVDVNGGWTLERLNALAPRLAELGVFMIEQPLPRGQDAVLDGYNKAIPLCADESCHTRADLDRLAGRYDYVNIKLDKTGGLTEALALVADARALGLEIMAGCMVATSLAMAPAMILAQGARVVDLDGPLLLARDREPGLIFHGSMIEPPSPALWG